MGFLFVIVIKFNKVSVYLFIYFPYCLLELGLIKIPLPGVDCPELAAIYSYQFASKKLKPFA